MSDPTDLIFEEPPPAAPKGRTSPVNAWLDTLRAHPGKWAKFPEPQMGSSVAHSINKAKRSNVEEGEFEAVCRATTNKRYFLYARYVGEVAK